jgi:hypothetical protein
MSARLTVRWALLIMAVLTSLAPLAWAAPLASPCLANASATGLATQSPATPGEQPPAVTLQDWAVAIGQASGVEVVYPPELGTTTLPDSAADLPCDLVLSVVLAKFNYLLSQSGEGTAQRIRVEVIDLRQAEIADQGHDVPGAEEAMARTYAVSAHDANDIALVSTESSAHVDRQDPAGPQPADESLMAIPQDIPSDHAAVNEANHMPPPEDISALLPEPIPLSPQELLMMDDGVPETMPMPGPMPGDDLMGMPNN